MNRINIWYFFIAVISSLCIYSLIVKDYEYSAFSLLIIGFVSSNFIYKDVRTKAWINIFEAILIVLIFILKIAKLLNNHLSIFCFFIVLIFYGYVFIIKINQRKNSSRK